MSTCNYFFPARFAGPISKKRLLKRLGWGVTMMSLLSSLVAAELPPPTPFTRCVNLSNALEAKTEGDWGYQIRADHIERIADAGFEAVRVPIKWSAHAATEPPFTLSSAILERVDIVAQSALDAKLQVIIDVHHFDQLMQDFEGQSPRLQAIWQQLSAHYADWPEGLLFELINEPYSPVNTRDIEQLNARLLEIIRRDNPLRWVVVGGAEYGHLDGLVSSTPPADNRLIATFHYYTPFDFTHQGAAFMDEPPAVGKNWGSAGERYRVHSDMQRAAAYGVYHKVPVLLGEFGVYRDVDDRLRADWIKSVRQSAETSGLGWCHWGWAADFRTFDLSTDDWVPEIKDALLE